MKFAWLQWFFFFFFFSGSLLTPSITWRIQGLLYRKNAAEDEMKVLEGSISRVEKKNQ
jgi:hypothetical protein